MSILTHRLHAMTLHEHSKRFHFRIVLFLEMLEGKSAECLRRPGPKAYKAPRSSHPIAEKKLGLSENSPWGQSFFEDRMGTPQSLIRFRAQAS